MSCIYVAACRNKQNMKKKSIHTHTYMQFHLPEVSWQAKIRNKRKNRTCKPGKIKPTVFITSGVENCRFLGHNEPTLQIWFRWIHVLTKTDMQSDEFRTDGSEWFKRRPGNLSSFPRGLGTYREHPLFGEGRSIG